MNKKEHKEEQKNNVSENQQDITQEKEAVAETADVEEENAHVEALEEKIKESEEKAKRYLADYQNLQRRVQDEKVNWIRQANKDLLLKLLPVLDTLMLAQKHIQDKGLEISIQQFENVLDQEGLKRIETKDKEFDPHVMEAVTTQQVDGKKHKVIEEVRAGYKLYDQVIRTAQVIVGE